MKSIKRHAYFPFYGAAFASGILVFLAVFKINFWLSWVCFVPFFWALYRQSPKSSFKIGFLFGMGMSAFSFFWMVPGAEKFTGNSVLYGFAIFLLCAILFSVYWAVISASFSFLKISLSNSFLAALANSLLITFLIIIGEYGLNIFASGMPWFAYHTGYGLIGNLYAIQPVAFLGLPALTFIVVIVNYTIAHFLIAKQYRKLAWPALGITTYLIIGYFILADFKKKVTNDKPIQVAVLSENIPPEIRWNASNGPKLVNRLLDLARQASLLKPDMALWSESAIPWTYRPDDDLVPELLKITEPASITHILGMNTAYVEEVVYNSVYCLLPSKEVAGRYDKRFLLNLIEAPIGDIIIPFLSSSGFYVEKGQTDAPLNTPYGKVGIMICNEAVVPAAAAEMVENGAKYLFVLSNDGWFRETYIVKQHFYNARLRAVETRKDVAVNSNNGISGLIKASGRIEWAKRSEDPYVKIASVVPNNFERESFRPMLLVYVGFIIIIVFLANKIMRYFINP